MHFSAIVFTLASISAEMVQDTPCIVNINGNIGSYIESKFLKGGSPAAGHETIKECEVVGTPEVPVVEHPCVTPPVIGEPPCVTAPVIVEPPCATAPVVVEPPCVTAPVIVEPPCVTAPSQVIEKSPVEVLVVNVIPQANQTQPTTASDPITSETPEPTTAPPSSAPSNPQPTVMVQQSVNLPNGQQGPSGGPGSGPFAGGCRGGCGFGRCGSCGFFSPLAAALRARVAARFGGRFGF
ncbi:hypothetical protein DSO57_1025395 [Entomophthora muscae]|uniref:Uncharacterized protein n=1 Tax=Entomophthora muscae TaxID=34485 RepID=A0ACC2RTF2_9FUNG|nr:hypothetical protein DSO57_1025395 [Entomophthora muscae]